MQKIAVYCGSSDKVAPAYLEIARQVGQLLAQRGITLIYGAGGTGMMGAAARAALLAGGEVVGIMPQIFDTPQLALTDITRYEVFPDMHTRLARIIDLAEGFIVLPGGYGTMDEFFQTVTWAQIGLHNKPVGLLNSNGYFDHLFLFLEHVEKEGFMYSGHNDLYLQASDPETLLDAMSAYVPPDDLATWVAREG